MTTRGMEKGHVFVALSEATILTLAQLRTRPDESVSDVIGRLADDQQPMSARDGQTSDENRCACNAAAEPAMRPRVPSTSRTSGAYRYELIVLGEMFRCASLADCLVHALRILAELDETFLDRLSQLGGRSRRHVASSPDHIHPMRPDLNREYTRELWPGSGWWVGTNYSRRDVEHILRDDACRLVGFDYGVDLVLRDA